MFKNYFHAAWRNIWRNKTFSIINIIGLSIGISASLVIYLIVSYDMSFDRAHKDGNRIYRVVTDLMFSGTTIHNMGVAMPMASSIRKDLSGLDLVVPVYVINSVKVNVDTTVFKNQDHMMYADPEYFRLVGYEWVAGSPATSLSQPHQVVLTESRAAVYFPGMRGEEIVGRNLYFDDSIHARVTGIVRDLPYRTTFSGQIFISWATLESANLWGDMDNWGSTSSNSQLFVKLAQEGNAKQMESKITALYQKYYGNQQPKSDNKTSHALQPLDDVHFSTIYGNVFDGDLSAHKPTLYGLLIVAALLLLLACINFINLTTAQSIKRAKEIGVRKTIGGSRQQLVFQFLSETLLVALAAIAFSMLLSPLLLKMFADFIPKGLEFNILTQPDIFVFGVLLLIGVTLLSGLYPAMVLSSYRPVLVLKNLLPAESRSGRRVGLRKALTVGQFVVAQVFIMGTLVVEKQISYSLNKDLGFKKDAIVYFKTDYQDTTRSHRFVLMEKLRAIPGVAMVSLSSDIPSANSTWSSELKFREGKKDFANLVEMKAVDTNYMRLYEMKLLAGRELPASDTVNALVINETYLHALGFQNPKEAINKRLEWNENIPVPIVGVVKDFHERSLHSAIKPLALCSQINQQRTINVAIDLKNTENNSLKTIMAQMKKAWSSIYPEETFDYKFQDETLAQFYQGEQRTALLLGWATGLMLFISGLGLFGLVIYVTNQRTKEVGIRKIVGATVTQIVVLLSSDFLKLVGWAFLIAVPLAWWGGHAWLANFAYRTSLSWWIFVVNGTLMGCIALMILLLRTVRAAHANPAERLRIE